MDQSPTNCRSDLCFATVTHKCRSKQRFTVLDDQALLSLMKSVGRPLSGDGRMERIVGNPPAGIYALPTNNVLELYIGHDGRARGYLFHNLDVWMSFVQ